MTSATATATAVKRTMPPFHEFVALVAVMMGLTALSIDIMLPALPLIEAAFAVTDPNDRQLVVTAYLVGFSGGQILYGPLSDRYGRKPVLLVGLALYALASIATVLSGSFTALLAARVVQGIGCAAPRVVALAVIRDVYGGREMARVMSFVMMVFIIVPVVAPGMGELLLFLGDWHWIFLFLLGVSIAVTLWTALRLPETRLAEDREPLSVAWLARAVWQTVSNRVTLGYTVAAGLIFGALLGYINSAQQIFVDVYDAGSMFAVLFGIITVALAAAAFLNGRMVERIGMRRMSHGALVGFVVTAAAHCALALAFGGVPPLALFCLMLALDLFFFGFLMPNFNAMAMEPLGRIAGTASSFIGAFTTAAAAICGWYVGRQFDGTVVPLTVGYLVLGLAALAIVLITEKGRLFHPQKPD